jgi:hypothetical protein
MKKIFKTISIIATLLLAINTNLHANDGRLWCERDVMTQESGWEGCCMQYPDIQGCESIRGGDGGDDDGTSTGVSEPIGILIGLTALSMFIVTRRRK